MLPWGLGSGTFRLMSERLFSYCDEGGGAELVAYARSDPALLERTLYFLFGGNIQAQAAHREEARKLVQLGIDQFENPPTPRAFASFLLAP